MGLLGLRQIQALATPSWIFRNSSSAGEAQMQALPHAMLWAWELPDDLRFIDTHDTGVAFLAETIFINPELNQTHRGIDIVIQPRRQPLRVPTGTWLIAVARIEDRTDSHWDATNISDISERVARLAEIPGVKGIQVDFDATYSQREFYGAMLRHLKRRMPANMPLSITALASWCLGDAWLDSLPVDEAVPMLFRMGVDDRFIRGLLADGRDFHSPVCRESLGLTTDEPMPVHSRAMLSGRRIYWFHPHPWTAAVFHDAVKGVRQ